MTTDDASAVTWVERAVERSAAVQRSRLRIANQVAQMLDAARKLINVKGDEFTTQELVSEAGVALQTFYRYFASKDELLLAVIGDAMTESCERMADAARELTDPLARLEFYLTTTLARLDGDSSTAATSRFIVATRWRLHRQFPIELAEAEKPFVDLLVSEVNAAVAAGVLKTTAPPWDSWFMSELLRSVYHFYAFAPRTEGDLEIAKERLWRFCLAALGCTTSPGEVSDT
jgi:AcrR family transcriptional regulator